MPTQSSRSRLAQLKKQPSLQDEDTNFNFFKMLVQAELINMPTMLSEKIVDPDIDEMFRRSMVEHESIQFHQYQEWIFHDLHRQLKSLDHQTLQSVAIRKQMF